MELLTKKVRTLKTGLEPNGFLRREIESRFFSIFEASKLNRFKNVHRGKRCLIVGNGPSIKSLDLAHLKNEITFATNMFALADKSCLFEPTYYCISDWIHWKNGFSKNLLTGIQRYNKTKFFLEYDSKRVVQKTPELCTRDVSYLFVGNLEVVKGNFSVDVRKPVCWGRSVVVDFCIPLACFMGFQEIYLIGVDYNYDVKDQKDVGQSYFYDGAKDDREVLASPDHVVVTGKDWHIELVMRGLEVVKSALAGTEHHIHNAGVGGKVEVFPRVHYEELFEKRTKTL